NQFAFEISSAEPDALLCAMVAAKGKVAAQWKMLPVLLDDDLDGPHPHFRFDLKHRREETVRVGRSDLCARRRLIVHARQSTTEISDMETELEHVVQEFLRVLHELRGQALWLEHHHSVGEPLRIW